MAIKDYLVPNGIQNLTIVYICDNTPFIDKLN